jgi:hypothetical protein
MPLNSTRTVWNERTGAGAQGGETQLPGEAPLGLGYVV